MSGERGQEVSVLEPPVRSATDIRLKVCLVGPSLDILGGQAVQLDRLRRKLSLVPEVEVSFVPVNPRLPGPLDLLRRVKYLRTAATSIAYLASLLRHLRHVDVVHAYSASYWSFLLAPVPAMAIGRLYRKGVVLNYHSGEAEDHLSNWRSARPPMRLAHRIVVPSRYLVQVFARHGLEALEVGNFVELERYEFRLRSRPRPVFLSNRNLEKHYNIPCILRAFARICAQETEAKLIVVGEGKERRNLDALARTLGIRERVEFRGKVGPERMPSVYSEADVFLNSSDVDNVPLSIVEAYASGLPVVSSDAGGIPDMVADGQTGLLVPRGDDTALAAAALRVVREEGLAARLGAAARLLCESRYSWSAVRDAWLGVYRDAVRMARRGRWR
jgi:glycosyltransferase involved in cell wall biosynthesis